jgi:dTMP kinase
MRGKFLVVEGIDGAGKSTHLEFICQQIRAARGVDVMLTREPGGSPLAEQIRELILHQPMDGPTEVLLAFAARRDHLEKKILPALACGTWVVCDRFTDSTLAYQGGGRGVPLDWIESIAQVVHGGLVPDRVYLFDAPAALAAERRAQRAGHVDRFEAQDLAFFERVRQVYVSRLKVLPEVYRLIDSSQTVPRIQSLLSKDLLSL